MEKATRNLGMIRSCYLDIITGTWDIMELPNIEYRYTEIFLNFQQNTIPVAKLFYKVIIDTASSRGVVLIGEKQ